MNKKIIMVMSIVVILIIMGIEISYAISTLEENTFFEVNETQISPNDTLEMTFNLSSIEYDQFTIVLNTNINTGEIYTDNEEDLTIENDEEDISIDIDKTKININQITLYYVIPEDMEIGTNIKITAQVIVNVEEETESETIIIDEENEILVIEKEEDDVENQTTLNEANTQESSKQEEKTTTQTADNSQQSTQNQNSTTSKQTSTQTTSSETATYNGSNNNYLSSLEIEGTTINTNFNKENGTYFATVSNQTSVNVDYVVEDSTATVRITGNDNLKSGENKILISVTAENGNVRYYRIFLTVED